MGRKRVYATESDRVRAFRERQSEHIKARQAETLAEGVAPAPSVESIPATKRWRMLLSKAREAVETVREEMTTYQTDRSERWQESDRAEEFAARIEAVESLLSSFDELNG